MKKNFSCLFILLLLTSTAFGQFKKQRTKLGSFDIIYSEKIFQENFYDQLNGFQSYTRSNSLTSVGFGVTGPIYVSRRSMIDNKKAYLINGRFSFSVIIPREIKIQDSINGKISGIKFEIPIIGLDLLHKAKKADILVYAGLNTGSLRMFSNELIRQKNPYVSPKIAICPRFAIGKIVLSLNAGYEYDISGTSWRKTLFASKDNKVEIGKFRQSGLTCSASIGLNFN